LVGKETILWVIYLFGLIGVPGIPFLPGLEWGKGLRLPRWSWVKGLKGPFGIFGKEFLDKGNSFVVKFNPFGLVPYPSALFF